MSKSKEEIVETIHEAVDSLKRIDWQRLQQWSSTLKRSSSDVVFEALYSIFVDETRPMTKYLDQEYAGKLLWAVKPICSMQPRESIKGVLKNYELSIEELPWYFEHVFGKQELRAILKEIKEGALTETEKRSVETFLYWLNISEESKKNDAM